MKAQKSRKQREADARLLADDDLRAVLELPAGRRFFWSLIDDDSIAFTGEALSTAYNEGARHVRVELKLRAQRVSRKQYVTMVREMIDRVAAEPLPDDAEETLDDDE